ncbi:MAG: leucine-rich repeat domain-containing protein [Spirochaetaceae bacterium]|nr:leucine-rich repeat domain-containing protein [Spirochaetaceae bacterium]
MEYKAIEFLVSRLPPYHARSKGIAFQPAYPVGYVYEKSVVDVGPNPYDPYETEIEGDFTASQNDKVFVNVEVKKYRTFKEARNQFLERCRLAEDDQISLGLERGLQIGDISAGDAMFLDFVRANILVRIEAVHAEHAEAYAILPMAEELDRQIIASLGLTPETLEAGYAKPPNRDIRNVVPGSGGFAATVTGKSVRISGYFGTSPQVIIPDQINTLPVSSIGDWAFYEKGLRKVLIPRNLRVIGDWAFMGNYLRQIQIPPKLEAIGGMAFYNNYLTEIAIPDSVSVIGKEAFCGNKLTQALLPNRILRLESGVFAENSLTKIDIPASVTEIGISAFAGNRLNRISLPRGVTLIENRAFQDNPLTNIDIPGDVKLPENSDAPAFGNGFDVYYLEKGSLSGTYRFANQRWSRQGE